jgi:hypothetical protein
MPQVLPETIFSLDRPRLDNPDVLQRMAQYLLNLFTPNRCPHDFAWPRKRQDGEHYQVCKLCGAEYLYDWHLMRRSGRQFA